MASTICLKKRENHMKPYERALTAVKLAEPDQLPLFLQICGFAATSTGFSLMDYLTKGKVLAEVQLEAARRYRNDVLFAFLDYCVEAEALGAKLAFSDQSYPHIKAVGLTDWHQIQDLEVPDPFSAYRMPVVLEACRLLAEKDGGEHFLVGQVLGPTTIAAQIFGIENLLFLSFDDPVGFAALLQFTARVTKVFAGALFEVGAQAVMVSDPSASPNVFPKEMFCAYVQPLLGEIFSGLKQKYQKVNWVQITGNATSILPFLCSLEVDIITVDSPVFMDKALDIIQGKAVSGNLNPFLFLSGSYKQIDTATEALFEHRHRLGFILGTGCEIPLDADPQKVEYLVKLVRRGQA